MEQDGRIDAFLANAQPFARPILEHLRTLAHATVPGLAETIKWGMPHFTLDGKTVCGMGAFKAHCSFIVEGAGDRGGDGMGHFGKVRSLADLPGDEIIAELILARVARIESGVKRPAAPRAAKAEVAVPDDFAAALSPAARVFFDGLAPGHRREYLEWIVSAKRAETRSKRIVQAAEWLAEGKKRNWKYEGC